IVVATPGRLLDHIRQRHVALDAIEVLVLDEADHMLDLGFLPQMRDVLRRVPRERQTMMFSATMPDSIEMIARDFMRDPVRIDIAGRGIDVPGITHVINFDIPENVDDYVHRGGRTARGAALGIESTIATWQDIPMVRQIEAILGEKIPRCTVAGIEPWTES